MQQEANRQAKVNVGDVVQYAVLDSDLVGTFGVIREKREVKA
jgi:hypothetical protein